MQNLDIRLIMSHHIKAAAKAFLEEPIETKLRWSYNVSHVLRLNYFTLLSGLRDVA